MGLHDGGICNKIIFYSRLFEIFLYIFFILHLNKVLQKLFKCIYNLHEEIFCLIVFFILNTCN